MINSNSQITWTRTTIKQSSYLKGRIGWQGLRASEFTRDGPYLITGTDFKDDGTIDWNSCYHVSMQRYEQASNIHVKNGDLLITKDGTIGKVAYVLSCPEKALLNSGVFLLRCSDGSYDHRFMFHLLRSPIFDEFLRVNLAGSTIHHLYQHIFEGFEFPIPDINEQKAIANVLDVVDEDISKTESLIIKLKAVKQGMLHDLLAFGLNERGQIRNPLTHPEQFTESPIGIVPREWEVVRLHERANIFGGKRLPMGHDYVSEPTGYCYLRVIDFCDRNIEFENLKCLDPKTFELLSRYEIKNGEVYISIAGSLGYSGVFRPLGNIRTILTENAARIVLQNGLEPEFLALQINGENAQRQINQEKGISAGVPKLALFRIENLWIVIPDKEEQSKITCAITIQNKQIAKEEFYLNKLKAIKNGLIQDLLTGKVRVRLHDMARSKG